MNWLALAVSIAALLVALYRNTNRDRRVAENDRRLSRMERVLRHHHFELPDGN